MPHMNATGPEGKGSGTGRKPGNCQNPATQSNESFLHGTGQGKKRHSTGGTGKSKQLEYN